MFNEIENRSLEENLQMLLSYYSKEEIDRYQEIVNEAEQYTAETQINCNIITIEEGSNG